MQKKTKLFLAFFLLVVFAKTGLAQTFTKNISLSFSVEPVFTIQVASIEGGQDLNFGDLSTTGKGAIITRSLEVSIISNTGTPYKVIQQSARPATNEKGEALPEDSIKFHLLPSRDTKGRLEVTSPTNVTGEQVIFSSGPDGASDKFTIVYELKSPGLLNAGDYLTSLTLTAR